MFKASSFHSSLQAPQQNANHSVARKKLYKVLQQHEVKFEDKSMEMMLADARTQNIEVLMATVDIIFNSFPLS